MHKILLALMTSDSETIRTGGLYPSILTTVICGILDEGSKASLLGYEEFSRGRDGVEMSIRSCSSGAVLRVDIKSGERAMPNLS